MNTLWNECFYRNDEFVKIVPSENCVVFRGWNLADETEKMHAMKIIIKTFTQN